MSEMDDLIEFIKARLDEDAVGARLHFWRSRAEAEVDAKRRIMDLYVDAVHLARVGEETDDDAKWDWISKREALERVLPVLALPYAGHPDYRREWRP